LDRAQRDAPSLRMLFRKGAVETILFLASKGEARYSEVKRQRFLVGDRSLSRLLRELQRKGLVERRALPTFPVSTSYSLTDRGRMAAKHLEGLRSLVSG